MTRKYRPYLTLTELKTLRDLSHSQSQSSTLTLYLDKYVSDIDSGFRKPNSISEPTMAESLGFTPPEEKTRHDAAQMNRYLTGQMSKQEVLDWELSQGVTFK